MKHCGFVIVLIAFLATGCVGTGSRVDGTTRAPRAPAIYDLDHQPPKNYREIAALTFRGSRPDESKARRYFVKEAKRLGADGVIIYTPGDGFTKGGRFGLGTDFIFKASAIVLVKPQPGG